jgi:hypothetical protein
MAGERRRNWKELLAREFKRLFFIVLYLWVLLTVFQLHRAIILASHGISFSYQQGLIFALVNALVLGKFMAVAEALHAGERWQGKPLLYSVLFKSAVFSGILLGCHVLERVLVAAWHSTSLGRAFEVLSLVEVLLLGFMVFVVLIPFFAARELIRVLGKERMKSLFFGGASTAHINEA